MNIRTDLAMERAMRLPYDMKGVTVERETCHGLETTLVRVRTNQAAQRLGKPIGDYWTLMHPELPRLSPEERMDIAEKIAQTLRRLLPQSGDVLVLGLGNRRMTADALGSRTVEGIMVTRHLHETALRNVCALSPGVLGVTGIETAEMAACLADKLRPEAVIVIDALAAMETSHIGTTVQVTDAGIHPGSGVGNHRQGITETTLHVPVIAIGIPMVVYTSTIVRDALECILAGENNEEEAGRMAKQLAGQASQCEMVVTPREVDETVQNLADMLALAINAALQPAFSMEELSHCLH